MSWKCVCKEKDNPDEANICKNCGRKRPKYLGVTLALESGETMSEEQKAVWYLMIAYNHLNEAREYLEIHRDLSVKLGDESYDQSAVRSRRQEVCDKAESNCSEVDPIVWTA